MTLLDGRPDDRAGSLQRVEDQAREHQLPGGRGQPVAGYCQCREGPSPVHEGDLPARMAAAAHPDCRADSAESARRENEAERACRSMKVVLDDVGEQYFSWPEEHEVCDGGGAERAPEPHALPDEAQAFPD